MAIKNEIWNLSMNEIKKKIAEAALSACLMEVLSAKPGNVYPGGEWNFHDLKVIDFIRSSMAIYYAFLNDDYSSVGQLILNAIIQTRHVTSTNTNLGQMILLAPLALTFFHHGNIAEDTIQNTINKLNIQDSQSVYRAIRLANPGGMGDVKDHDILEVPTLPLDQIMQMAMSYDSVAKQYTNGFHDIISIGITSLLDNSFSTEEWQDMTIWCHLHFMARLPDTLIARKCGWKIAEESAKMAERVLEHHPGSSSYRSELKSLDQWLRAVGHSRNPGTTADLVTATLFVALLHGRIQKPADIETRVAFQLKSVEEN